MKTCSHALKVENQEKSHHNIKTASYSHLEQDREAKNTINITDY